jgi:hypothetical protein
MNDYLVQAGKDIEAAYQELKKARKEALDSGNQFQLLVLNEITTDLSHIRATLNQVTT